MQRRYIICIAFLAPALFAGGWWLGSRMSSADPPTVPAAPSNEELVAQLQDSVADRNRQIAELSDHLDSALHDLEDQRQIIREHELTNTTRSVDELLALFPAKYPAGNWAPAETVFEDCWFETVDGLRLHGWYLQHTAPRAVILYAHGNAGNVTHRAAVSARLHQLLGVSVFLFDYRGYGRSEGVPTIEGLIRDARAARKYLALREGIPREDVVLLGRSLGGAVAVELAAADGARALVLESTFSTLREVAVAHYPELLVNLLVADRLDSRAAITRFHGPVLISHGNADQTIPIALGRQLFDAANEPKTFVVIPGGDHNDPQSDEYYKQLDRFLTDLSRP